MNTTMSSGNLQSFLRLLDDKGVTPEKFTSVLSSGMLADIFESGASLDKRDALRETLGLSPLRFEFEVDYDLSFEEMVAAGHYDWRNDNLNERNFPIKGKGKKRFEGKLFAANCSSEEGIKHILAEDQVKPWKPGETEHILAFGVAFPDVQRKTPVVALGSSAGVGGIRDVPFLDGSVAERNLFLGWWGDDWSGGCRFLGVREVSGSVA